MDPRVILVAAIAENRVIGIDQGLPWRLKSDMTRFRILTEGGVVIMGRTTHESIMASLGKPLPNRTNVVLTRGSVPKGWIAMQTLNEAIQIGNGDKNVFIIGGARVYASALPLAHELHLTTVHASPQGDTLFPVFRIDEFRERESMRFERDASRNDDFDFTFSIFRRVRYADPKSFVFLPNARTPRQWATMERIQLDGVCPFCARYLTAYHHQPLLAESQYWILTKNQWPYGNTKEHFLVIARRHWERLRDVSPKAWEDLGALLELAEAQFNLTSGGLGLRFGDSAGNGGSVRHLHWQLLQADVVDPKHPLYRKVRLGLN